MTAHEAYLGEVTCRACGTRRNVYYDRRDICPQCGADYGVPMSIVELSERLRVIKSEDTRRTPV